MLTALLATATSALFGVADFLGGLASRRDSAFAVTASAHALGMIAFALGVVLFPVPYTTTAAVAGVAAGVSGGIGVVSLYAALARGRMSVVAPVTAALSGSLPAVFGLLRGESITPIDYVGLALALAATVVVSANSGEDAEDGPAALPPVALVLSLVAGVGFAGSFISFSFAGDASGFWPLFAARVTSFAMLGAVALVRRGTLRLVPEARPSTVGAGLLDAAANVTMISAIRIGPLAVASVLGSLYPVFTLLLARIVLHERLRGIQRIGVALALLAVLITAWP